MKTTLECPRCSARRIWYVRNALEHSDDGPTLLGAPQGLSPMEVFICGECGFSEWYTAQPRSLEPRPDAAMVPLNDHRMSCRSCQSRDHLLVARFEEVERLPAVPPNSWVVPLAVSRNSRGVASGTFAVVICRDCGILTWFACDMTPPPAKLARGCRRCGAEALARIDRVEEIGGHALPIAMHGRREIGHFHLEMCVVCGLSDWFGERFSRLVADGKDILLLQGVAPPPSAPDKIPYR
jgi:predicted nucleic-acid-binding Zn-ribbon protein